MTDLLSLRYAEDFSDIEEFLDAAEQFLDAVT